MTSFNTRYTSSNNSPGFMLWKVTHLWQRYLRDTLEALDLTHMQFVLLASLAWLAQDGTVITQVQLAQHAEVDVMMTSQVVRTLEHKTLIVRLPHPSDARAKALALTEHGMAVTNQAVALVEAADAMFFARIDPDQATLLRLLNSLDRPVSTAR